MHRLTSTLATAAVLLNISISPIACLASNNEDSTQPGKNMAPCISWSSPVVKSRFAMLCIPGLGLYSNSYKSFGERMSRRGAAIYAIDVRGFGSWMKAKGHQQIDFDSCLEDIRATLNSIHKAHPGLPVFLVGESMGGAIALKAASLYPELIDGLISSVPAGERFQNKRTDLKVAMEMLKGPNKQFDIGSQIIQQASTEHVFSTDDRKVQIVNDKLLHDWEGDPLDRMSLSPNELIQFQRFMNENHESAKHIFKTPVLFIQGIDDQLVRPDGTWDLFKELSTNDRTMVALPSRHLILEQAQDTSKDLNAESTHLIMGWVLSKLAESASAEPATLSTTAPPDPADNQLKSAIEKLVLADYPAATAALQDIIKTQPGSAEAHYWLGVSYLKQHRPVVARTELSTALRIGSGNRHSRQANDILLSLSGSQTAKPNTDGGVSTPEVLSEQPAVKVTAVTESGKKITKGKPTVLMFYADWCEQCNKLDNVVLQGRQMFGNQVNFVKIAVGDKANDELIQDFNVGPIPTMVFLQKDGAVSSTLIGESSFVNMAKGIANILH